MVDLSKRTFKFFETVQKRRPIIKQTEKFKNSLQKQRCPIDLCVTQINQTWSFNFTSKKNTKTHHQLVVMSSKLVAFEEGVSRVVIPQCCASNGNKCLNISILPFSSLPFSKTLLQISATKILVRPPKKKRNGLRLGRIRLIGTRYRKEKKHTSILKKEISKQSGKKLKTT